MAATTDPTLTINLTFNPISFSDPNSISFCITRTPLSPTVPLSGNDSDEDRYVLIIDFWHPELTEDEQEALEFIYDARNKFETGNTKWPRTLI